MIYFDIETVPAFDIGHPVADLMRGNVSAPSNWKDEDKIAAYVVEKTEQAMAKQALTAQTAKVVCIVAYDSDKDRWFKEMDDGEGYLLRNFARWLDAGDPQPVCGFNIMKYDVPVLLFAYMRTGVQAPGMIIQNRPFLSSGSVDLFQWFGGMGMSKGLMISMAACGMDVDPDNDGAKVWDHWKAGDHDLIMKHCVDDVIGCIMLFKRIYGFTTTPDRYGQIRPEHADDDEPLF